jgi:hypothetical protein
MPSVKNLPGRAIGVAGNAFKGASKGLRSLAGNFTEGAMIVLFLAAFVLSIVQKRPNVALCALAAALGVTAFSESLALGLTVGLALVAVDFFLRYREPFANPNEGEEEETEKEATTEAMKDKGSKKSKKGKSNAPDNGERAEFLELGKKYKLPSEDDDADVHLDAGSTFMNAYKSLKPDQLAAMTKDTQDLMQTQKQLMSTLQTLKPLIMDGKEMMNTFQSYFGQGGSAPR